MQPLAKDTGASWASVTLASVLRVRGQALREEEIWSLLSMAAERLWEDLRHDSSDYVFCPWSFLLSAAGSLSFQDHVSHVEAAPFKAPEMLRGWKDDEKPDMSQMHVYSLGMTLYWSAGFHVPPNQPLQLSEHLHTILLTMCEDQAGKRPPLPSVLEACRAHQDEVAVYPAPPSLRIRRLVGLVLGRITEVERRVVEESSSRQQDRSYLLRKRLHQASSESPLARALGCLHPRRVSERSTATQSSWEFSSRAPGCSPCSPSVNSMLPGEASKSLEEGPHLSNGAAFSAAAENSRSAAPSQRGFPQRKERLSRPEFILLAAETPVTLHLPGCIVTKKRKSYLALRDLCVVLLNGQCLEVKCDIGSTVGAVFHAVTSFSNLEELTYFGLAYVRDNEFFFLDHETRLCKIAPAGWSEPPWKKTSATSFTLFLRIKFFVSHFGLLQHSLTRHQFYLQLRKDILEERLYCHDETLLHLGALALQAEFGNYPQEVVTGSWDLPVWSLEK